MTNEHYKLSDYKTKNEKIAFLEGMAYGIWQCDIYWNDTDDHHKPYDPLTISYENKKPVGRSYVFNFHDGGRIHRFESLNEILEGLLKEVRK